MKRDKFGTLKKYIVYGDPGQGKTILAVVISCMYNRIYGNVGIKRNGKLITKYIENFTELQDIEYSTERGLLILDEMGANANSKDVRTEGNRIMVEESIFLQRKKNLDVIFLSQQMESFDIGIRRGQNAIVLECKGNNGYYHPYFLIWKIKTNKKGENIGFEGQYFIDLIKYLKKNKVTYNTLETSKIKKKK